MTFDGRCYACEKVDNRLPVLTEEAVQCKQVNFGKEPERVFRNAVTCLTTLGLLDWLLKGTNSEAESSKNVKRKVITNRIGALMKPWMVVRYKNPELIELEGAELTASRTKARKVGWLMMDIRGTRGLRV